MKKIRMGVFGLGRGSSFYNNIKMNGGEIVAVCDRDEKKLAKAKELLGEELVTYTDFDSFIEHEGLEAVFLCNFFHEHAPYAIRALEKNIHVLTECASNGTMAEGVALVRAAEKSTAFFMISENYPFMKFNLEMRRVYRGGTLGKLLFAEGEYNHPIDPMDTKAVKGLRPYAKHWRNFLPRTYYVTHALAPLMYMTGAVPTRISAVSIHAPFPEESVMHYGAVRDRASIIITQNDDGSVFRVTGCAAFGAHDNAYRLCGEKGQIENIRGDEKVLLRYNKWDVPEGAERSAIYTPEWADGDREQIEKSGHGGGDFLVMREFLTCIKENRRPVFDEYFATTMASVGILAHRSALERGVPYDIPDFRKEEDRKKYENDTLTPFYGTDGSEPTLPATSRTDCAHTEEDVAAYDRIMAEID